MRSRAMLSVLLQPLNTSIGPYFRSYHNSEGVEVGCNEIITNDMGSVQLPIRYKIYLSYPENGTVISLVLF